MTRDRLEAVLRAVQPAARLVPSRHLVKVLWYLRDHGRAVPANPALPFWAARAELLDADVLSETAMAGTEPRLLLLTEPDDRNVGHLPDGEHLRAYWRVLFQAAVLAAIDTKLADGRLTPAACADRLARLGAAAAREIRYVLETDHLIDPAADAAATYRSFAAAYLDLYHFAPAAVEEFFPSIPPALAVLVALGEDVDIAAALTHSRPAGAPDTDPELPPDERWLAADREQPVAVTAGTDATRLLARALDAERKRNFVRAAILRTQAATTQSGDVATCSTHAAGRAVERLVDAIAGVTGWDDEAQGEWRKALAPLLGPAAAGIWPRAARCLYELQKIPGELADEVYAVDLVEFVRTLGRRPVKRPLPHAREVMLLTHLRAAHRQLLHSAAGEQAQLRLDRLFHHELHRLEHRIRHALTPIITAALAASGFAPSDRVEEVARDKVVAELLDRVCEQGQLRFGDLRDAVARNQLKMPDLSGPTEFVGGDPLLRTDTRLAYDLDGVYRRGEAYLRALQRGSAVFFGTPVGRLLTLYLIGPLLASFLTLMALEELRHIGGKTAAFASKILAPHPAAPPPAPAPAPQPASGFGVDEEAGDLIWFDPEEATTLVREVASSTAATTGAGPEHAHHASFLIQPPTVVGLAVFLLLVFHVPPVRRAVVSAARAAWHAVRFVAWDVPHAVARSPLVRAARYSTPTRFVTRRLGGAAILTACVLILLAGLGAAPKRLLTWGAVVFAVAVVVFNTPLGRVAQERAAEALSDWWRVVRVNLLPGVVTALLEAFRRLANWVERQLYAVDEWLRFRRGDSGGSFYLKAAAGLVWFPVAYLARFTFYLLIEPQINPVKHFPVVTVSHKVILPMTPSLATALNVSDATAAGLLACIPGVFGFIAWELLANWRLYRANRPPRLAAVVIGSHGETMRGLLRPGFHSGAVPKLFRKLRAAERHGARTAAARHHHDLEHAAEAVQRFVEREFVARLDRCHAWGGVRTEVAGVRVGCQRVVVEITAPAVGHEALAVAFENRGGRIGAEVVRYGWADTLSAGQRSALTAALRGLFDMGAADLVCEDARDPAARGAGGDADLARPFTWGEWVARWEEVGSKA